MLRDLKKTSTDLKWHSEWLKRPTMPLKKYTVHFNRMIESIVNTVDKCACAPVDLDLNLLAILAWVINTGKSSTEIYNNWTFHRNIIILQSNVIMVSLLVSDHKTRMDGADFPEFSIP